MKLRIHGLLILAIICVLMLLHATAQSPDPFAVTNAIEPRDVLSYLRDTIAWHERLSAERQLATDANDLAFMNDDRQYADRILRLSFDFAKAAADILAKSKTPQTLTSQEGAPRLQSLTNLVAKADQRIKENQQNISDLRKKLETATGRSRNTIISAINEVQSELDLAQTRRDVLRSMLDFAAGASSGSGDLRSQIEELQRAVPAAAASEAAASVSTANTPAANDVRRYGPSGIIALSADLFVLNRKLRTLDKAIQSTEDLTQKGKGLRSPFIKALKQLSTRGDQVANLPDSNDNAVLAQQRAEIEALTASFKQLSTVVLPLSKQSILLDLDRRNLIGWRDSVKSQYSEELRSLLIRLVMLLVAIVLVIGLSKLWSRAIVRYVHDSRRQHQLMIVHRFVVWFAIGVIVAFAFATEIGSLATFAGLITAGVAVALQNVIQSVVGYFFLIGKYGVRPGDRVQIAGVVGEVVDVGLVRFHLMEIEGEGHRPTGRIVVFSNSVIFQPNASFFKQVPGTSFAWHEITLTLASDTDYRLVDERLLAVVQDIFAQYRDRIEQQRHQMERALTPIIVGSLTPQSRLHLTKAGLEVVIRYPVEIAHAAEIDDRITRGLLTAIESEPRLKMIGSPTATIEQVQPAGQTAK